VEKLGAGELKVRKRRPSEIHGKLAKIETVKLKYHHNHQYADLSRWVRVYAAL
jgi:hypothetical protein